MLPDEQPCHKAFGPLPDEAITPYVNATLRYDPLLVHSAANSESSFKTPCPFYLLEHQWTRLQVARWSVLAGGKAKPSDAGLTPAHFLHGLLQAVQQWRKAPTEDEGKNGSLRIRIRSYVNGRITTEIVPTLPRSLRELFPSGFYIAPDSVTSPWTIGLDDRPTEISETTMYKTSDRAWYARARAKAGIMTLFDPAEVLLYNTDDDVLDGTLMTPYFYRGGRWVTPSSASGGQQGTTRRWALEHGLCIEGEVSRSSLVDGERIWLSNAVKGFFWGVFRAKALSGDEKAFEQTGAIAKTL